LDNNAESTTAAETQCSANSRSVTNAALPEDKAVHNQATVRHSSLLIPDTAYQADRTRDDCQTRTKSYKTLDLILQLTQNIATIVTQVIRELSKGSQ
jgi:hypothetical protein